MMNQYPEKVATAIMTGYPLHRQAVPGGPEKKRQTWKHYRKQAHLRATAAMHQQESSAAQTRRGWYRAAIVTSRSRASRTPRPASLPTALDQSTVTAAVVDQVSDSTPKPATKRSHYRNCDSHCKYRPSPRLRLRQKIAAQ
jgi:hypothetical protein